MPSCAIKQHFKIFLAQFQLSMQENIFAYIANSIFGSHPTFTTRENGPTPNSARERDIFLSVPVFNIQ